MDQTNQKVKAAAASRPLASGVGGRRLLVLVLLLCIGGALLAYSARRRSLGPGRHFEAAMAGLRAGEMEAVRREIGQLDPLPEYAPHCHYLRGALLLREGRPREASDELSYSLYHPKLEIDAHVSLGQALYQQGRAAQAVTMWNRALQIDPDTVGAHRWLAVYYYDLGAMDNALVHLETVSRLDTSDARSPRLMGLINRDYDRFGEAVKHYRESLRRDDHQPDRDALLTEYAECEIKLHNYESALGLLAKCAPSATSTLLTAECHLSLGDQARALRLIDEALKSDPNHLKGLLLAGRIHLEKGDAVSAAELLARAVDAHPKDHEVRFKLAQALRLAGQGDEADRQNVVAEDLRKSWERFSNLNTDAVNDPGNADLRFQIGEAALELDRVELAREWFRAALHLDPSHQRARERFNSLGKPAEPPAPQAARQ